MKTFKIVSMHKVISMVCDGCGLEANTDGDYEFQEFITINHRCSYGSIHGDGNQIETDLCQQCFADMCGDSLRVTDESTCAISNASEYNESCATRLAARAILSKNVIDGKNELIIALKRVEQLWDAQYQSAEGNELHQLADLISTYEKKDWNSFFEQEPLTDDDFF